MCSFMLLEAGPGRAASTVVYIAALVLGTEGCGRRRQGASWGVPVPMISGTREANQTDENALIQQ